MSRKNGFTLLELSIVLVIIGLVVGGVLVGTDLIRSAKLQKVMREAQGYANAVSTFKLKYNGLPGDMLNPDEFFPDQVWPPFLNEADLTMSNDGIINGGFEGADAWRQLGLAGFINASNLGGSESCGSTSSVGVSCAQRSTTSSPTAPGSAYSDKASWFIGFNPFTRRNAVMIAGSGINAPRSWNLRSGVLTSLGARNIDQKMDDGLPLTGAVQTGTRMQANSADNTQSDYQDRSQYKCLTEAGVGGEYTYSGRDGEPVCSLMFPLGI